MRATRSAGVQDLDGDECGVLRDPVQSGANDARNSGTVSIFISIQLVRKVAAPDCAAAKLLSKIVRPFSTTPNFSKFDVPGE